MEQDVNPYEYYNGKLGIKISYIITDKNPHNESLRLISYKALNGRMNSNTCAEKQLRKRSYNICALVLFSSLCREWREHLILKFGKPEEEVKKSWFSQHYQFDGKAFDFFAAHTYGEGIKLDLKLAQTYAYNASVLNTVIAVKNNRKAYIKALDATKIDIWESLTRDVNAFREVEHNLPTTSRGLRIKVTNYLKDGYVSIISGRLQNQNATKVQSDEQLALLDELLAQHQNPDNHQVAKLYNVVAATLGWKTITPDTVGVRKKDRNLVVFAGRNGSTELSNKILMQIKRRPPSKPMLFWTMDGWDSELLYQKTTVNKKGQKVTTYYHRLTMVVVLDPFNKYPVGYAIGTHETPELIKAALRNALQHTRELFGAFYRPYQLQTDNYGRGALTSTYEACTVHYTPAKVKNAKAKVIEPWFNRFNKDYLQMFNNWSGYNVDSGSKNQPNDEMLNKLRHQFPNESECRQQLITAIEAYRATKREDYVNKWKEVPAEHRSVMSFESYMQFLGQTSGFTNRMQPEGLIQKLNGVERYYDSFDMNFRLRLHLDWAIYFDPEDLSHVLVVDAVSERGKIKEVIGKHRFILQEKYIQSMALADRAPDDAEQLAAVRQYNDDVMKYISDTRQENHEVLSELFLKPELNDTLTKMVIVDSRGQHKNRRNDRRIKDNARELIEVQATTDKKEKDNTWYQEQQEYNNSKVNLSDYGINS